MICDETRKIGMKTGHEKKEEDKRGEHRPRWGRRVIRSLSDEEGVDPKSDWSQDVKKRMP